MPNQQIIITLIISFCIWVVSSFATLIFNRLFDKYIPERKKLISYIKNILFFIVAYVIPIVWIILLMKDTVVVDKFFVLSMAFGFFALATNFSIYIQNITRKSLIELAGITHKAINSIFDTNRIFYKEVADLTHSAEISDVVRESVLAIFDSLNETSKLMQGLNDLQNILHKRLEALEDERQKKKH